MPRIEDLLWSAKDFVVDYSVNRLGIKFNFDDIQFLPYKLLWGALHLPDVLQAKFAVAARHGVPNALTSLSANTVFAVAALGSCSIALEVGKKLISPRFCESCSGWHALRCTLCGGTGETRFQVTNVNLPSGVKATAEQVAEAIVANRAELVQLPSAIDYSSPLPKKTCEMCSGSGVMSCNECENRVRWRISLDRVMGTPREACNILQSIEYPYESIWKSMKNPEIAKFWLFTLPEALGGNKIPDDRKSELWHQMEKRLQYDRLRDIVAMRLPNWENLQGVLASVDPESAKEDPVVIKNIPFYKARKALEAEVMKLEVPPRPPNWGELNLPLKESLWSKHGLKNPRKSYEMKVLLDAQKEVADKILDNQWERTWRKTKLSELLEERVKPYLENVENDVLVDPIIVQAQVKTEDTARKPARRRRWWLF